MTTLYDLLYNIDYCFGDIRFDKICGVSIIGDVGSDAYKHPIQYVAMTKIRPGDDDAYEGFGWTPTEVVRNLYHLLLKRFPPED